MEQKAYDLIDSLQLDHLLVTLGKDGMTLYSKDKTAYHACSYAEQVYDVTGAGDTVIASLAVNFAEGKDKVQAVEFASHAAAIVVSKIGTSYAARDNVRQLMSQKIPQDNNKDPILQIKTKEQLEYLFKNERDVEAKLCCWDYNDNILSAKNIADFLQRNKTDTKRRSG